MAITGSSIYRAKRAASLANPITTAKVWLQNDNSAWASYVALTSPMQSGDTSIRFRLRARGRVTTGGTYTHVVKFQFNSDLSIPTQWASAITAANNTDFVTLTSASPATVTRPWFLDADCIWDSTSQRLGGIQSGINNEVVGPAFTTITALTGVDLTTGKCGFVCNCLIGTTNVLNFAYLDDFTLEVL